MYITLKVATVPSDFPFSEEINEKYLPQIDKRLKDEEKIKVALDEIEDKRIFFQSLDPDFGRIIAVGGYVFDIDDLSELGKDENQTNFNLEKEFFICNENEKLLLESFWKLVEEKYCNYTITFNGLSFDLPFLFKRSMYNGVRVPIPTALRRFTHQPHFDLMQALSFFGGVTYRSLPFYEEIFGIEKKERLDARSVLLAWQKGDTQAIKKTIMSQTTSIVEIFKRIHSYFM